MGRRERERSRFKSSFQSIMYYNITRMGDAAQLEIELLRTRERVRALEEVVQSQSEALKESSKLLARCRPHPRPIIPHDRKILTAAEQGWKCADPYGDCPMWRLSDGVFSACGGLFEVDHIEPFHTGFRTIGNLQAICPVCHNAKCRRERLAAMEAGDANAEHDTPTT